MGAETHRLPGEALPEGGQSPVLYRGNENNLNLVQDEVKLIEVSWSCILGESGQTLRLTMIYAPAELNYFLVQVGWSSMTLHERM